MTAALSPNFPQAAPGRNFESHVAPTAPRLAPEIYRARRLTVMALALGLVLGAMLGIASMGDQAGASRGDLAPGAGAMVITVMPGDTLWGIALELAPGSDPRPIVHTLSQIAGSGPLQPGQQLVIPESLAG